MYNLDVSCEILLTFIKRNCINDIEDICKQKNIQLGIEIESARKSIKHLTPQNTTCGVPIARELPNTRESTQLSAGPITPPPVDVMKTSLDSRLVTPGSIRNTHTVEDSPTEDENIPEVKANLHLDEVAIAQQRKGKLEKQLAVVRKASQVVKELQQNGVSLDLTDMEGNRMHIHKAGATRANNLLQSRKTYEVVVVHGNDKEEVNIEPLRYILNSSDI